MLRLWRTPFFGRPSASANVRPPIGLLAGWGRFPIAVAEKARAAGVPLVCVAIRGMADPVLKDLAPHFYWTRLGRLGHTIHCFRREGVERFAMAGKVHKVVLFSAWRWLHLLPDWRMLRFWFDRMRRDNRDDSLLLGLVREFEKDGLRCVSALDLCPELHVRSGTLTRRAPTPAEERDVEFGWEIAKEMGRLDVGQTVVVQERTVLAVEAIEGTDQAILRAGTLSRRPGLVVVKVAKPRQDMRFDVPTVGTQTIESMRQAGGLVLAIEAGKTILLDEAETIALADRYGIAVTAR
jgi:DUF1009 family protein